MSCISGQLRSTVGDAIKQKTTAKWLQKSSTSHEMQSSECLTTCGEQDLSIMMSENSTIRPRMSQEGKGGFFGLNRMIQNSCTLFWVHTEQVLILTGRFNVPSTVSVPMSAPGPAGAGQGHARRDVSPAWLRPSGGLETAGREKESHGRRTCKSRPNPESGNGSNVRNPVQNLEWEQKMIIQWMFIYFLMPFYGPDNMTGALLK
jgi:hypothetical protein